MLKFSITICFNCIVFLTALSQSFATYRETQGTTVGKIDHTTGVYTPMSGIIGFSSLFTTIDPVKGHFIGVIQGWPWQPDASLQTIDMSTGDVLHHIPLGDISNGIRQIEFNPCNSTLYAARKEPSGVTIGTLDNTTGTYTPLTGLIGFYPQFIAIDPNKGHLIGVIQDFPGQPFGSLQTIDLSTGNVIHHIPLGDLSSGIRHLEFNSCDSTLYAFYKEANGVTMGKLDNTTGAYVPLSGIVGFTSQFTAIDAVNNQLICITQDVPSQPYASLKTLDLSTGTTLYNSSINQLPFSVNHLEIMNSCCGDSGSASEMICENLPNILTPDNDGVNDLLYFDFSEKITVKLDVMNRWGNLIYSAEGYKNTWGKEAENLSEGVYFYKLTDENNKTCSSFLHIVRD